MGYWEFGTRRRPKNQFLTPIMKGMVERLQENVRRAMRSKTPTGPVGTGKFPEVETDKPETKPIMEANYARLVARGEGQSWSFEDEVALHDRVRRVR